jgi:hypothetical protein
MTEIIDVEFAGFDFLQGHQDLIIKKWIFLVANRGTFIVKRDTFFYETLPASVS